MKDGFPATRLLKSISRLMVLRRRPMRSRRYNELLSYSFCKTLRY